MGFNLEEFSFYSIERMPQTVTLLLHSYADKRLVSVPNSCRRGFHPIVRDSHTIGPLSRLHHLSLRTKQNHSRKASVPGKFTTIMPSPELVSLLILAVFTLIAMLDTTKDASVKGNRILVSPALGEVCLLFVGKRRTYRVWWRSGSSFWIDTVIVWLRIAGLCQLRSRNFSK